MALTATSLSRSNALHTIAGGTANRFIGRKPFAATFGGRDREVSSGVPRGISPAVPPCTAYTPNEDVVSRRLPSRAGGGGAGNAWSGRLTTQGERTLGPAVFQQLPQRALQKQKGGGKGASTAVGSSSLDGSWGPRRSAAGTSQPAPTPKEQRRRRGSGSGSDADASDDGRSDSDDDGREEEVDEFGLRTGRLLPPKASAARAPSPMDIQMAQKRRQRDIILSRRAGTPGPGAYDPKVGATSSITSPSALQGPSPSVCSVKMAAGALHARYGFAASPFAAPFTVASSVFSSGGVGVRTPAMESGGFASASTANFRAGGGGGGQSSGGGSTTASGEHSGPVFSLISGDNHMDQRSYVALMQTKRSMEALFSYLAACALSQEELGKVMIMLVTWELRREMAERNRRKILGLSTGGANGGDTTTLSTNSTTTAGTSPMKAGGSGAAKGPSRAKDRSAAAAGAGAVPANASSHYAHSAAALTELVGANAAESLLRNAKHRGALSPEGDRLLRQMFPEQTVKPVTVTATSLAEAQARGSNSGAGGSSFHNATAANNNNTSISNNTGTGGEEGAEEGTSASPSSTSASAIDSPTAGGGDASSSAAGASSAGDQQQQLHQPLRLKRAAKLGDVEPDGLADMQWYFMVDAAQNVVLADANGNVLPHPSTMALERAQITDLAILDPSSSAAAGNGTTSSGSGAGPRGSRQLPALANPNAITPAVVHRLSYKHPIFASARIQLVAHVAATVGLLTSRAAAASSSSSKGQPLRVGTPASSLRRDRPPKAPAMGRDAALHRSSGYDDSDDSEGGGNAREKRESRFVTGPTEQYPRDINEIARSILGLLPRPLSEQKAAIEEEEQRRATLKAAAREAAAERQQQKQQKQQQRANSSAGGAGTTGPSQGRLSRSAAATPHSLLSPSSSSATRTPSRMGRGPTDAISGGGVGTPSRASRLLSTPASSPHRGITSNSRSHTPNTANANNTSNSNTTSAAVGTSGAAGANGSSVHTSLVGTGSRYVWSPPSMVDAMPGGVMATAGRGDHEARVAELRETLVRRLADKEKARRRQERAEAAGRALSSMVGGVGGGGGDVSAVSAGAGGNNTASATDVSAVSSSPHMHNNNSIINTARPPNGGGGGGGGAKGQSIGVLPSGTDEDWAPYREVYPEAGGTAFRRFRPPTIGDAALLASTGGGGGDSSAAASSSFLFGGGGGGGPSAFTSSASRVPAGLTAGCNYLGPSRPIRTQYDGHPRTDAAAALAAVDASASAPFPSLANSPTNNSNAAHAGGMGVANNGSSGGDGHSQQQTHAHHVSVDGAYARTAFASQNASLRHKQPGHHGYYTVEYPPLPMGLRGEGDGSGERSAGAGGLLGEGSGADGDGASVGTALTHRFVGNDPSQYRSTMHIATHYTYVDHPRAKLIGLDQRRRERARARQRGMGAEGNGASVGPSSAFDEARDDPYFGGAEASALANSAAANGNNASAAWRHPAFEESSSSDDEDELMTAVVARNLTSHSYHISDSPPCLNTRGAFSLAGGARSKLSSVNQSAFSAHNTTLNAVEAFMATTGGIGGGLGPEAEADPRGPSALLSHHRSPSGAKGKGGGAHRRGSASPSPTSTTAFSGTGIGAAAKASAFISPSAYNSLTDAQRAQRHLQLLKQERGANISAATVLPQQLAPDDVGFRYDAATTGKRSVADNRLARIHRQRDRLVAQSNESTTLLRPQSAEGGDGSDAEEGCVEGNARRSHRSALASPGAILVRQFAGIRYKDEFKRQEKEKEKQRQRQSSIGGGGQGGGAASSDPTLLEGYVPSGGGGVGGGGGASTSSYARFTKSRLISSLFGSAKDLADDADIIASTRALLGQ